MRTLSAIALLVLLAAGAAFAQNAPAAAPTFTIQPQVQRDFGPVPKDSGDPRFSGHFSLVPQVHVRSALPKIDRNGFLPLSGDTCYKLQKYIFRRDDGSDRTTLVGSTDCTRASRVTTESADDPNAKPTGPGLSKAVLRVKPAPPNNH
jgi:hypothetical protein